MAPKIAHSQGEYRPDPSLFEMMRCSYDHEFYTSDSNWYVTRHETCLRNFHGYPYSYFTAIQGRRMIAWHSDGGNRVSTYSILSINLETGAYIAYEAVLGIRGQGLINSLIVTGRGGQNAIPMDNILSVLQWERGIYGYSDSQNIEPEGGSIAIRPAHLYSESGGLINVRGWPGLNAPITRQSQSGQRVTVWEYRVIDGDTWYKVALRDSNAVGWVRSDLLRFED